MLQAQREYEAARPLLERALAICERELGADHPDTATSLINLGSLLYEQGSMRHGRYWSERWRFVSGCWGQTTRTRPAA
ncbi:MAG: tetratricopeptide repeat protein [Chloroflexota bacterium]